MYLKYTTRVITSNGYTRPNDLIVSHTAWRVNSVVVMQRRDVVQPTNITTQHLSIYLDLSISLGIYRVTEINRDNYVSLCVNFR
jgi:hypothetical protein